jgi:hypothetical protein
MTRKVLLAFLIIILITFIGCPSQKPSPKEPPGKDKIESEKSTAERSLAQQVPGGCDQWAVDILPGGEIIQVQARECGTLHDLANYKFNFAISDNQGMANANSSTDRTFSELPVTFDFTESSSGEPLAYGEVYWITVSISENGGTQVYLLESFPVFNAPDGIAGQVIKHENGKIYMAGYFSGCIDFDPGAGERKLIAKHRDCFLAVYDETGNYIWAGSWGGEKEDQVRDIAIDNSGNVFLTGFVMGDADMDPSPDAVNNYMVTGDRDGFVMKFAYDSAGNTYSLENYKGIAGTGLFDEGYCVDIDESGIVSVTGIFEGVFNLKPSLVATGGTDIYIAKFSDSLTPIDSNKYGVDNEYDLSPLPETCSDGRTYLTGCRTTVVNGQRIGNTFLTVLAASGGVLKDIPDIGIVGIWDEGEELVCDPPGSWNVRVIGDVKKTLTTCYKFEDDYIFPDTWSGDRLRYPIDCREVGDQRYVLNDAWYFTGASDRKDNYPTLVIYYDNKSRGEKTIVCNENVGDEGTGLLVESGTAYVTGRQIDKTSGAISGMFLAIINTADEEGQCEVYITLPVM